MQPIPSHCLWKKNATHTSYTHFKKNIKCIWMHSNYFRLLGLYFLSIRVFSRRLFERFERPMCSFIFHSTDLYQFNSKNERMNYQKCWSYKFSFIHSAMVVHTLFSAITNNSSSWLACEKKGKCSNSVTSSIFYNSTLFLSFSIWKHSI